jgi:hypothetical protein
MSRAFKGCRRTPANAAVIFDKFHAVRIINDGGDQVRRGERKG